jgi:Uma2 family endonuclease
MIEEFNAFCDLPENADRHFELYDGQIVEKDMAGMKSSAVSMEIARLIGNFAAATKPRIGWLTDAQGSYTINEANHFMPDIGFILKARMSELIESASPVAPDLAVEVLSPTDRLRRLQRKAELYMVNGSRLVWLVIPKTKQVMVYAVGDELLVLNAEDTIDGGDVLPGFSCRVADFFPEG